jgi:hypothetical protein
MKKICLILFTSFACLGKVKTQGLANILDQKAAELKYYEQQIAWLELYIRDLEKGYQWVQQALNDISEIKKGELTLHQAFFNALSNLNPAISGTGRIAQILSLQLSIMGQFKSALRSNQSFSGSEMAYLQKVYSNLLTACGTDLAELMDLVGGGSLTLTDDQRIRRMDEIYSDMVDKWAFTQSFTSGSGLLAAQRAGEENEAAFLQKLY